MGTNATKMWLGLGWSIQSDAGALLIRAVHSADLSSGFSSAIRGAMLNATVGERGVKLELLAESRQECLELQHLSREAILGAHGRFVATELEPPHETPSLDPKFRRAEAHYRVTVAR